MALKNLTEKITLPVAIVIAAVVLAIGFYAVQYNKQESIERQQALELEKDREVETAKLEQAQKEYLAERKKDCLDIYQTESGEWSNVRGWRYDEEDDLCYIRYRDGSPKTDAQCEENYPIGGDWELVFFRSNLLCKDGEFENSF